MKKTAIIIGIAAIALLLIAGYAAVSLIGNQTAEPSPYSPSQFETITNSESGVTIDVTPLNLDKLNEPLKFDVTLTTHEGSMDFEMTENSVLLDSKGKEYGPTGWDGSPPGGHHRSGTLTFPAVKDVGNVKLVIKDVNGVSERIFEWRRK